MAKTHVHIWGQQALTHSLGFVRTIFSSPEVLRKNVFTSNRKRKKDVVHATKICKLSNYIDLMPEIFLALQRVSSVPHKLFNVKFRNVFFSSEKMNCVYCMKARTSSADDEYLRQKPHVCKTDVFRLVRSCDCE